MEGAMGKLSIPRDTKGYYDRREKTLTVFVGERAFVRFTGSTAETKDVTFSAWGGSSGERAAEVYRENQTTLDVAIDTSSPARIAFTATSGDGKPLAAPITILIRMRPDYGSSRAIGQQDSNACWAACLAWWLGAAGNRVPISQLELIGKAHGMWNADGTINPDKLETFVRKERFGMHTQRVQPRDLKSFMGYWPLLIGFTAPGGFGHMNVLYSYDESLSSVAGMEPWYPDPDFDLSYTSDDVGGVPVYYSKKDGAPYPFTGANLRSTYARYGNKPLRAGYFWVGFPEEYLAQI
jgi:hypothetical protein